MIGIRLNFKDLNFLNKAEGNCIRMLSELGFELKQIDNPNYVISENKRSYKFSKISNDLRDVNNILRNIRISKEKLINS